MVVQEILKKVSVYLFTKSHKKWKNEFLCCIKNYNLAKIIKKKLQKLFKLHLKIFPPAKEKLLKDKEISFSQSTTAIAKLSWLYSYSKKTCNSAVCPRNWEWIFWYSLTRMQLWISQTIFWKKNWLIEVFLKKIQNMLQ